MLRRDRVPRPTADLRRAIWPARPGASRGPTRSWLIRSSPSGYPVNRTHAKDNRDEATVAFVIANAALGSDKETMVFLSSEGVRLAQRGYVGFGKISSRYASLRLVALCLEVAN